MYKKMRNGKKTAVMSLAAALLLTTVTGGRQVSAAEKTLADLHELTAPKRETEAGSAVSASLKIGDWLDYGDYELERSDIPGTAYFFYITTKDEQGNVINDETLAYCIESYFLTPLPGDHSDEMTDHITLLGDGTTLNKILYYGYSGPAYERTEFETFLQKENAEYYETVYANLEEHEKEEVSYILTHTAASYAYFTEATSFETYLNLQFEIKYGEKWEKEYGYFREQELKKAGIAEDMDLLGATYGMNSEGIELTRAWYELLSGKQDPVLDVISEGGFFTFYGNANNEELSLEFAVPENFFCIIEEADNGQIQAEAGEMVTVYPDDQFSFVYTGEQFATEQGAISEEEAVSAALNGAEEEVWSLVLLETSKGNTESVTKRQQDITGLSRIDAGKNALDFVIALQKGTIALTLSDEETHPIQGAVFDVFYDEACESPVCQNGEAVQLITDETGEVYLEFIVNEEMLDNDSRLYIKEAQTPTGYEEERSVYSVAVDECLELINERETTAVSGTVNWNVPDDALIPEAIQISLLQNDEVIDTKAVTEAEDWAYTWENLIKYTSDEDGNVQEAIYELQVDPVEGFDTTITGFDIENIVTGLLDVEGEIVWEDEGDKDQLRPDTVTVELLCDGEAVDNLEISEAEDWNYQFTDLEQYSEDGSEEYKYSTALIAPDGYEITVKNGKIIAVHEVVPETETEQVTEMEAMTETEQITETEAVTETESETETDKAAVSDDTGAAEEQSSVLPGVLFVCVILLLLYALFMRIRKK